MAALAVQAFATALPGFSSPSGLPAACAGANEAGGKPAGCAPRRVLMPASGSARSEGVSQCLS